MDQNNVMTDVWNPPKQGSSKREEMPSHAFLLPKERKFPFKKKVNGKWVISCEGLRQAIVRAQQHGYASVLKKARQLYQKHCKKD